jgi:hypothetical protein
MCQICGMPPEFNFLGNLGSLFYYVCVFCGMQFSTKDGSRFENAEED